MHAHPSWLESPGLSSLEAAATGARIVVGDRGTEREYFGSDVDYADPADPASIRAAVLRALERGPRDRGDALERRLGARTWQRCAEATLEAYARAVAAAPLMRILVAAERLGPAGGMERYLEVVLPAWRRAARPCTSLARERRRRRERVPGPASRRSGWRGRTSTTRPTTARGMPSRRRWRASRPTSCWRRT